MANFSEKQEVKLFPDENYIGNQLVSIDVEDKFMTVIHDGNEFNLTIDNWLKLMDLSIKALNKAFPDEQL